MYKFKIGDRVFMPDERVEGEVLAIQFMFGTDCYMVEWNNYYGKISYFPIAQADTLWLFARDCQDLIPQYGNRNITSGMTASVNSQAVHTHNDKHIWKLYQGFRESYFYCERCDEKSFQKSVPTGGCSGCKRS